jgi:hypothetical protein
VLRARLPRTDSWRLLYVFGMTGTFGLSRSLGGGRAFSMGTGFDAVENPIVDQRTGAKSATLRPKVGMYYDRDGSLLWSLAIGSPRSAVSWLTMSAYPGVLHVGRWSPGVWLQLPKGGGVRLGLASTLGVGIASGSAR